MGYIRIGYSNYEGVLTMSIYDRLVGCIPVNKIAGCAVSLHPEDFQQTGVEERIKQLGRTGSWNYHR